MEIFLWKTFSFHSQEFLYISCLWIFNLIICILLLNLQVWNLRFICSLIYLFIYLFICLFIYLFIYSFWMKLFAILCCHKYSVIDEKYDFFTWYFKKLHIVCWLTISNKKEINIYVWITKSDLSKSKAIFNFTRAQDAGRGRWGNNFCC